MTLVSGPTQEPNPIGIKVERIENAAEMMKACKRALPVDVAVCVAAVSDWRIKQPYDQKIKWLEDPPAIHLTKNLDILEGLSTAGNLRPRLVIGFAAETESIIKNAIKKRVCKGCDWIIANDVSSGEKVMGGKHNRVHIITDKGVEEWPCLDKIEVGRRLAERIADHLATLP